MSIMPYKIDDGAAEDDDGLSLRNCGYGIALVLCYVSLVLLIGAAISAGF